MPAWLSQNIGTILIIAVLVAFFALLIWSLIRDRKKGKSSCCGGCAGCANACYCHPNAAKPAEDTKSESECQATPAEEVSP